MNIIILGSGNVASYLAENFSHQGHKIIQVYSRTKANAYALASAFGADATAELASLRRDADLYLLAVSDSAILEIMQSPPAIDHGILVHCSGATPLSVLDAYEQYGVIYPPQSISKNVSTPIAAIPFAIEGNTPAIQALLLQLMQAMAPKAFPCTTEQRLALHVAAVFANNFSNLLFQISYDLLNEHQLSFDLLRPIILETAQKVQNKRPDEVQTGPAKRGDQQTLERHLNFLSEKASWLKIYQQLSEEIRRKANS